MVLSVPLADLLVFRKLAKAYFALMEVRPSPLVCRGRPAWRSARSALFMWPPALQALHYIPFGSGVHCNNYYYYYIP
jgi:hypothetical protein